MKCEKATIERGALGFLKTNCEAWRENCEEPMTTGISLSVSKGVSPSKRGKSNSWVGSSVAERGKEALLPYLYFLVQNSTDKWLCKFSRKGKWL